MIPKEKPKPEGGRNRVPARVVMTGIIYRMKTGCQWRAIPNEFGSGQLVIEDFKNGSVQEYSKRYINAF
ncbi:hypothetical protein LEP1GSC024_3813 [Leptospira noguchii str. 2001034031]|uniref:Insertion element IS402-like domain-containing protein n=1 Tax=Leptospira noguchii str. 2001034031 TaxID=1193053 RepID=M6Y8A0_9LEPT|nr:hypothetical protein LEP1GSC024_3813 [Leptospira noguchii str. 2001034031]